MGQFLIVKNPIFSSPCLTLTARISAILFWPTHRTRGRRKEKVMMFNEATNSWEKPAMAWPGQQLSSVFPAAGMETGEKAMEGEVLHFPLQETKT